MWNLLVLYDASKTNYLKDISARGRAYGPSFTDRAMETEHNTEIPNLSEGKKKPIFFVCFLSSSYLALLSASFSLSISDR